MVFLSSLFLFLLVCVKVLQTNGEQNFRIPGSATSSSVSNSQALDHSLLFLSGGAQWDGDEREEPFHDRQAPSRRHKKKSSLSRFAEQSLSLTTKAVSATAKHSGKAAFHLIRPKQVDLKELFGLWRLDQYVVFRDDERPVEATSSIEITPQGTVLVLQRDNEDENEADQPSRYSFTPSRLAASAKLEFTAAAFSVGDEVPPIRFFYRAYVHRKIADSSVIKLKGKIYRVERVGWRGKNEKLVAVGTFVARRRLKLAEDDGDENESSEDEEWSEEEEEWVSDAAESDSVDEPGTAEEYDWDEED